MNATEILFLGCLVLLMIPAFLEFDPISEMLREQREEEKRLKKQLRHDRGDYTLLEKIIRRFKPSEDDSL